MDFETLAKTRQSCRSYNPKKPVEDEKIQSILKVSALSPSACNSQPYHFTVCKGEIAKQVAKATMSMGINSFADKAPVLLVISEEPYSKSAALGARIKGNDYRSIDIGIVSAYITAQATELGLGSCILGWFDEKKVRSLCNCSGTVRLVITLGYAKDDDLLRNKKRKTLEELATIL